MALPERSRSILLGEPDREEQSLLGTYGPVLRATSWQGDGTGHPEWTVERLRTLLRGRKRESEIVFFVFSTKRGGPSARNNFAESLFGVAGAEKKTQFTKCNLHDGT